MTDLGDIDLYGSQQKGETSRDKYLRGDSPSDEELAYQIRQDSLDAAEKEAVADTRAPINPYSLREFGNRVLPYISPAGAMFLKRMRENETKAYLEAASKSETVNQTGQTPSQVAQGAMDRLDIGQSGQRVVGMTKAGFVPSVRQSQTQVTRPGLPPGYWDLVNREMGERSAAGESDIAQETETERMKSHAADLQRGLEDQFVSEDENARLNEDRSLLGAQQRINSAIDEFKKSGPKMITYRDLWDQADTGGKITMALGLIAGALGSGQRGRSNGFLDELDNTIHRKIDIQQRESERLGRAIGDEQNAYQVLQQRFRDRTAARNVLHAMYLKQFLGKVEDQARNIGIGYENGRLQALKADIDEKTRQLLRDSAGQIQEQEANSAKYMPATAIVAGPSSAELEAGDQEANKYEEERRKKLLPEKRAGIQLLREGAQALSDRGIAGRTLLKKFLKDPNSLTSSVILEGSGDKEALNKLASGIDLLLRQEGGKTLTESEIARGLSRYVGTGSKNDILKGSQTAQDEVDQIEQSLHSAFPRGYPIGNLRRKVTGNTEQPHEIKGEEKQPDITKDVVAPKFPTAAAKKKKGER